MRVVRSSGKQAADRAAIATVRAAAPFPQPPAGINNTFLDRDRLPLIRRAWTIVGVAVALALLLLVGIGWMEGVYSTAPTISQTRSALAASSPAGWRKKQSIAAIGFKHNRRRAAMRRGMSQSVFAVIGMTGHVGGAVAQTLLAEKRHVRAVMRDATRGLPWAVRGCERALADLNDAASLASAFNGAEGVFVMLPPFFDPSPGFPEARAMIAALRSALLAARPRKVVCLSTVGAQVKRQNLLTQLSILEQELGDLPIPVTFLRPAWFMENFAWDIKAARQGLF